MTTPQPAESPRPLRSILAALLRWALLAVPVGLLAGSASALFLWALERATELRWAHPWLLYLLPLAGAAVGAVYLWIGRPARAGTNLIIDEIHTPGGGVPWRMAPLILLGTVVTHLFGGSAGREGTALQMGGSLASGFGRLCRVTPGTMQVLLMAGVSAGFGSVFGTPLAGAVFAMEILVIGRMQYDALLPVLVAALVGDATCAAWGIRHTAYHLALDPDAELRAVLTAPLLAKVVVAAVAFGLAARLFAELTHGLQHRLEHWFPSVPLRAAVGGVAVIALVFAVGSRDYLGLGVHNPDPHAVTILSAFHPGGATTWSWAWKLLFTAVTLAAGFKGGEVTPLFYIGAALGNTLAGWLGTPVDLLAGIGFIAVFAGATNTPLACTLMGIELFGSHYAVYFAVGCFLAYYASGHTSIYLSQRLGSGKQAGAVAPHHLTVRDHRNRQP